MSTVIVLAMIGAPPRDYPPADLQAYFKIRLQVEALGHNQGGNGPNGNGWELRQRFASLDAKLRAWPRSRMNDPYFAGSIDIADKLKQHTGLHAIVGFNEFCAPRLEDAFEQAHTFGADRVVVITPVMTSGASDAEVDIPLRISEAEELYPEMHFFYAWPFDTRDVAAFLAGQASSYLPFHKEAEQVWR